MNKQGPTGINWTDATWNPVTGCKHGCPYCYAAAISHRLNRSFDPTFHRKRLGEPLKERNPQKIFTCSMADLFGRWVPSAWIRAVLDVVEQTPRHTYQFLTKNPSRLAEFNPWPTNAWVGSTIDTPARLNLTLTALHTVDAPVRFISFEPLNGDMGQPALAGAVEWIIIGAQTGKGGHQPQESWVDGLLEAAHVANLPVLMKDNLVWQPRREEFPTHLLVSVPALAQPYAQAPLPL